MVIKEYILTHDENSTPVLKAIKEIDFVNIYESPEEFSVYLLKDEYYMDVLDSENVYLVMFDGRDRPLGVFHVSIGSYNRCDVYNRTIATILLLTGTKQFLVVHNHPEAQLEASDADKANDAGLYGLGRLLQIDFLGSYIINRNGYLKVGNKKHVVWEV